MEQIEVSAAFLMHCLIPSIETSYLLVGNSRAKWNNAVEQRLGSHTQGADNLVLNKIPAVTFINFRNDLISLSLFLSIVK